MPGVSVAWSVVAGAGTIAPAVGATDADGLVATSWTLGPDLVANTVHAVASGLAPAQFDTTPYSLLDRWILDRPAIAEAIVWQDAEGFHPFAEWTVSQRSDLLDLLRVRAGRLIPHR